MSRVRAIVLLLVLLSLAGIIAGTPHAGPQERTELTPSESLLLQETGALSRFLIGLAAAKQSADVARHDICVFSVHPGQKVKKYTDNQCVLVFLPVSKSEERMGAIRYATAYNNFVLDYADTLALTGKYELAGQIYALLKRYDCSGGALATQAVERLKILPKLKSGSSEGRDQLQKLRNAFFTSLDLSGLEAKECQTVTNLLEVVPGP